MGTGITVACGILGVHCDSERVSGYPRINPQAGVETGAAFTTGWFTLESGEVVTYTSSNIHGSLNDNDTNTFDALGAAVQHSRPYQVASYREYVRGFPFAAVSYWVLGSHPSGAHENVSKESLWEFPTYKRIDIQWIALGVNIVVWSLLYCICFLLVSSTKRIARRRRGCCVNCGYSLRANISGVCPECGTVAREYGGGE